MSAEPSTRSPLVALDELPASRAPDEIRLFACARDEELRLPAFLDHYRALGVDRFFIVDNGSIDGTAARLAAEHDVHVFRADGSFARARSGLAWVEELCARFAADAWCVCVDVDELLVYPGCESRSLHELAAYLEDSDASALFSLLLDVYARGPIADAHYVAGQDPLTVCPYFDPGTHYAGGTNSRGYPTPAHRRAGLDHFRGGMRLRVFGVDLCLNKVPFYKNGPGVRLTQGQHFIENATIGDVTAASLHFKYCADFVARVNQAVERGEHWLNASSYRDYRRVLERSPRLSPWNEASVRYQDSGTLVTRGLVRTTARWNRWVQSEDGADRAVAGA